MEQMYRQQINQPIQPDQYSGMPVQPIEGMQMPSISQQDMGLAPPQQMMQGQLPSVEDARAELKPIIIGKNIFQMVENNKIDTLMHHL